MRRPSRPGASLPAIGRFIERITSRKFWTLRRKDASGAGGSYARFAALLAGFSVVAMTTLVVVIVALLVPGNGSGSLVTPLGSPSQTAEPTSTGPAGGRFEAPWIDAQMIEDDPLMAAQILEDSVGVTGVPQFGTAAHHIRQAVAEGEPLNIPWLCPIVDYYNTGYSADRTGTLVCSGDLVTPQPTEESVSLAVWASETATWWFDDIPASAIAYREGDEPPFLLTWEAEPGEEYAVTITYDCLVGNVPAIDFLAGVESAEADIFKALRGPGRTTPDAAAPLPDTPDLDIDDGSVRLLYLYGGDFLLLPEGPEPADGCSGERTISFPVKADAEELVLMGSLRLADSADHRGLGAADVATGIGFSASVEGVGDVSIKLEHGVIVR